MEWNGDTFAFGTSTSSSFGQLLTALHLQAMLLDVDEPASKCLATPTANGSAFCSF